MTKNEEIEKLKQIRKEYHHAGKTDLNTRIKSEGVMSWAITKINCGDYDVTIGILNKEIESLQDKIAEETKSSAPKHCPKCGTRMTASNRCDKCDDWDN